MALITLDFESQYMGSNQNVNIIVPDKPRELTPKQFYESGKKYKVLWLLHGTFGGYSDWIRRSNIETYACEKNLIVVMAGIGNADYENWNNFTLGLDSESYFIKELMPLVYNWLPASSAREDNYIAGLSMGGKGTLKFALKYPELFDAAAVLSYIPSEMDSHAEEYQELFDRSPEEIYHNTNDVMHSMQRQYNVMHNCGSVENYLNSDYNAWRILKQCDHSKLPRLLFACGTDDVLFASQIEPFKQYLKEIGLDVEWTLGPGNHEWRVWERDIQIAIDFFGLNEDKQGNAF